MVFVHARNATVRTAMTLREKAKNNGTIGLFQSKQSSEYGTAEKQVGNITWAKKKICRFPVSSYKNLGRVGRF